ncbi:hypothetical protein PED38_15580 [Clavibacter sp. CT19]|uniref:hypothetical protein n=1 Tax=Clavibacter sp. CT19 TaxID=3018990 RepID=UPI0022EAB0CD|nr:hypothetical protein [Clavibacter sp. CT19]MDA3806220.1 hypothetical protein [Clavibacter sp. CT19]
MELLRTYMALADAKFQMNQLAQMRPNLKDFNLLLPYVLDRLANVCRSINEETKGHRSADFSSWWDPLKDDPDLTTLTRARNDELKASTRTTTGTVELRVPGGPSWFIESVEATVTTADGTTQTVGTRYTIEAPENAVISVTFTVGAWAGREVMSVLQEVLARLELDIVPTAVRLAKAMR